MKQFILNNSQAMKRIFGVVTIAATMVACNPGPKSATELTPTPSATTDTTGFSQFQAWKAQNELANPNAFNNNMNAAAMTTTPNRSNSVSYTPARSRTTHSVSHRSSGRSRSYSSGNSGRYSSSSSNTARAKRGWSKAAKGAVIGGVAGGVAGAVINKRNRVAGGVVGAVLGTGVGYGIGRHMDKKDGRY